MVTKRIETLIVNFSTNFPLLTFESILHDLSVNHSVMHSVNGRRVELRLIAPNNDINQDIIVGVVITTKLNGLPPKHNTDTGETGSLGLDPSEGLGYANVFLYEKHRHLLLYEFNKNGTYLNQLIEFVKVKTEELYSHQTFNDSHLSVQLDFSSLLKSDAYQRMLTIGSYKKLEVDIANPTELMQYIDHSSIYGIALMDIVSPARILDSPKFSAVFSCGRSHSSHLNTNAFREIVEALRFALGTRHGGNIEKIRLTGYYTNPDGDTILQPIDLLTDRYLKFINLPEPKELRDFQEGQRRELIVSLYRSCLAELSRII